MMVLTVPATKQGKRAMASKQISLIVLFFSLSFAALSATPSCTTKTHVLKSVVEEPHRSVSGRSDLPLHQQTWDNFTILPIPAFGPESLDFLLTGEGPYTGVSDGRILKYEGPEIGFVEFAYTSPNRTREECDNVTALEKGPICGRPIGLGFNQRTKELYIADAFYGLCKVGPKGGLAQQVVTVAEGQPLKWLDGLDVDQRTGIVYFTDVSSVYTFVNVSEHLSSGDSTGRLISYNPKTGEVKVLMRDLRGPGGAVASEDSSFVLVSLLPGNRIYKYWLKGPKAGQGELFMSIEGPANMKLTPSGDIWVATSGQSQDPVPVFIPGGVKINNDGTILEKVALGGIYESTQINEIHEHAGSYYIGSLTVPFVGQI